MNETVEVAGVSVTQETLEQIFDALREHHWLGIPAQYVPRLARFSPITGTTANYENVVHDMMADGTVPRWFRERFMGVKAEPRSLTMTPMQVLERAAFPRIAYTVRSPWDELPPAMVYDWAQGINSPTPKWLWVACDNGTKRLDLLAQALIAANAKSDRDLRAVYRTAPEFCGEMATADNYGENSKHAAMRPYRECRLLIIDGIGDERRALPELRALATLVQVRHDQVLPTILASRMTLDEARSRYEATDRNEARAFFSAVTGGLTAYGRSAVSDCTLIL